MAKIVVSSHNFAISKCDVAMMREVNRFVVRFQLYSSRYQKGVGLIRKASKVYATANASRTEIRMHRNMLEDFLEWMEKRGYPKRSFDIVERPMYVPETCSPVMPDYMKARDYQEPQIAYGLDGKTRSKLLTLQTGKGKTFCALEIARQLGHRIFINIPAKYLDKWKKDVIETYGDSVKMLVIRGGSALRSLLALAKAGELDADVIVCSSNTLAKYLDEYKSSAVFTYEVEPPDMFEELEVGIRIIDEVHEGLHFNYRLDCYTHVPLTLSMSATLRGKEEVSSQVIDYMFPHHDRAPEMAYDRYVDVTGLGYRIKRPNTARFKNGGMYSHNTYEQWIMSELKRKLAYRDFIFGLMDTIYISKNNFKQKILVYAASIDLCKYLADEYKLLKPDLKISTKTQEDDFSVLDESNVIFSTLLSTGTAVDIEDLAYVLMTTSVDSEIANLQAIGRLRRMKNYPDQTPEFYYIACTDLEKQMLYHRNKQKLFMNRARKHRWMMTDMMLP